MRLPEEPKYRPWMNIHPLKVSVCVPHKNGNTSFGEALKKLIPQAALRRWKTAWTTDKLSLSDEPEYRAYFVVREPLDRFRSLFRDKCGPENGNYFGLNKLTPEALMDHIEKGRHDGHVRPQTDFLGDVAATVVDIQTFASLWEQWTGQKYPHEHRTRGEVNFDDELRDRVYSWYAGDLLLWSRRNK